jgi:cyanate lyase
MTRERIPISDQLRRAIKQCGLTRYEISKRTGIDNAVLCHFLHGRRGMSLDSIDRLGVCLGLDIRMVQKPKPNKGHKRR